MTSPPEHTDPIMLNAADGAPAFDEHAAAMPPPLAAHGGRRRSLGSQLERLRVRHLALVAILALSAVLNTRNLAQNGYANTFYAAGVKSMLRSLHNFLFVSFDPGGLVTIDKPPLAMWVQATSAKLFGFSPLSLLLPEAIISVISVAVLYRVVTRRLGASAGLLSALALAVFPSFVAVSRDNGVDPLLILLMILACGAALNAIESGRLRWLLASAALVGLAFNTKTLAAYPVVPGIAVGYLVCAAAPLPRRLGHLLLAGAVMVLVSFSWIALVELTPASQRPYVGSSTNNTELGLTFDYNGFGRVEGEVGGPGQIPTAEGGGLHVPPLPRDSARARARALARARARKRRHSKYLPDGRLSNVITFGEPVGPLRLFEAGLADQGAWLLPFALIGLAALALQALTDTRALRSRRLAVAIVFGGWLLAEAVLLSFSNGIVHPYYVSALGPGAAAMIGGGAVALASFARRRNWGLLLLPCAIAATVIVQVKILQQQEYMGWFVPLLIGLALVLGLGATFMRRFAGVALALTLGVLLVAPTVYAAITWQTPVNGTFPAAGPHETPGPGEYGVVAHSLRIDRNLTSYVRTHQPGRRFALLTDAAPTAAPFILLGLNAGALAGYSGSDPAVDGRQLARMVARGEARYVVLGGAYASRGGSPATKAVLHACRQVSLRAWHGAVPTSVYTLVLFDCAGRERQLSQPVPRT